MSANFISVVNDQTNVSDLIRAGQPNRPPVTLSAVTNLHTAPVQENNLYYICTATANTITLPQNYSSYKGKFLHFINQTTGSAVVNAAQENTTPATASGALFGYAGSKLNGAGAGQIVAAVAGAYTTLVCDGSTGWYYVMSG